MNSLQAVSTLLTLLPLAAALIFVPRPTGIGGTNGSLHSGAGDLPLIISTWNDTPAAEKAWQTLTSGGSVVDAVVDGCTLCEVLQCRLTVGYGSDPDESGATTLDAMVMDGKTHDVGAVGDLRNVRNAIGVARAVMDYTEHTLLVGESADAFAVEMGFPKQSLETNVSLAMWEAWKAQNCQPNFRRNVTPDPTKFCGPYKPSRISPQHTGVQISPNNHDTIGMLAVDKEGNVASGTTTSGLNHKVPGRVGDSPIVGAGSYASNGKGAAAATGNGDIMMRFLPSFKAVLLMEQGLSPMEAAREAIKPIIEVYPDFSGALIAANSMGAYGAACHNVKGGFHFVVRNSMMSQATLELVQCI